MKKLVTTVQFVFDIVHDESIAPIDVARLAADNAHDAIVWTTHPELEGAIDETVNRGEAPIAIVSSSVVNTRPYVHGEILCDGLDEGDNVS